LCCSFFVFNYVRSDYAFVRAILLFGFRHVEQPLESLF
jgi:hypothetical protein